MYKKTMLSLALCLSTVSATQQTTKPKDSITKKQKSYLQEGQTLNLAEFKSGEHAITYKIIKEGNGSKPYAGEKLTVHYTGHLLDGKNKVGKKFDSSVDRGKPFTFTLGSKQVISGWEHTLADMKTGETRIVILPPDQAYGNRATPTIPANSTLIFEITCIKAD